VRVGLLTLSGQARVRAPIGSLEAAREALGRVRPSLQRDGTNLAAAVGAGVRPLQRAAAPDRSRSGLLVLLPDGDATIPRPPD
jgi:Mg-chelatase subunit ChlD